jgi:hypothetical protein
MKENRENTKNYKKRKIKKRNRGLPPDSLGLKRLKGPDPSKPWRAPN